MKHSKTFKSAKMWMGFYLMLSSVVLAIISFIIDSLNVGSFAWFSASGAVMVTGSILFERLQPGANLGGRIKLASLPSLDDEIRKSDQWLMAYGGYISIAVLILGTLIWAYGSLIV